MNLKFIFIGCITILVLNACSTLNSGTSNLSNAYQYLLTAIEKYKELDINNNGLLSKSEVSGILLENFNLIDTDKNEGLSLSELTTYKSLIGL